MPSVVISDYVLDFGLAVLRNEATHIYVCTEQPTTFGEAITDFGSGGFALGSKDFGAGAVSLPAAAHWTAH
jgi:hypothetical protein